MRRPLIGRASAFVAAGAIVVATLGFMGATVAVAAPRVPLTATITLNPTSGPPGSKTTVTGKGFQANETVKITFHETKGIHILGNATADSTGAFSMVVKIPVHATLGAQTIQARGLTSNRVAKATFTVT